MEEDAKYTLDEAHLMFAKKTNGRVWELLDKRQRTDEEDQEMVHAAHASMFHWLHSGTAIHRQRGEWLVSRVHCVLGQGDEAVRHAQRCLDLTEKHKDLMQDFDVAFAHEGIARAHAVAGNREEARKHIELAREAGGAIEDDEDRKVFLDDFDGGEWHGLR